MHHIIFQTSNIHVTTHQERGNFQRLWQHHLINRLVCTARACEPSLYKAAETRTHRHLPPETMRAAAISTPRLDKMPGMFLSANPKELKGTDHSLLDDKTQKKRPKTFGMDVKAYLRSMIPHLESGMKPSKSKDLLSADEVKQWSESLEKLLANQTGQDVFGNFLKSEFSEENIEFWLACEDYKKTKSDLLHCKAEKIYKAFVQSDAAKQINIDFRTRESTAKKIKAPTPTSFDEAQKIIYTLMEKDSYPRFLKSNTYLNLLNDLQANSLK